MKGNLCGISPGCWVCRWRQPAVLNAIWFELMDDEATRRKLLERTKSLPDA
jgi:hypothetical protein